MRGIVQHSRYKKDLKREMRGSHRGSLQEDFTPILEALCNDQALPVKQKDHALTGNWNGFRDCHIKPDLVLVYTKEGGAEDGTLELIRLGSHAELGF